MGFVASWKLDWAPLGIGCRSFAFHRTSPEPHDCFHLERGIGHAAPLLLMAIYYSPNNSLDSRQNKLLAPCNLLPYEEILFTIV
jgi:hypothetical protein